jgi:hypothetical protein
MNKNNDIQNFVRNFLESIIKNDDPVGNYEELQKNRTDLIEKYNIDISKIEANEIIYELNKSRYLGLYQNLNLHDLANFVFLQNIENADKEKSIQAMLVGVNEKDGIEGIYNHDDYEEFNEISYGIDLNNIEKYFHATKNYQLAELRGNVATFLEYYSNTKEGKAFIKTYDKNDEVGKSSFFKELFEKMNDASVIKMFDFHNGKQNYISGKAGCLDGLFIICDDSKNMTFNVSSTISKDVTREEDSILRHAVTSKLISMAISEKIDDKLKATNENNPTFDKPYDINKDRSDTWRKMSGDKNASYKNTFIYEAIVEKLKNGNISINTKFDQYDIESGIAVKNMIIEMNSLKPSLVINKILKSDGDVTNNKMNIFFESLKNFNTHFLSNAPDILNTKEFKISTLKKSLDLKSLTMVDFRAFLQLGALKDITLEKHLREENVAGFTKNAIDFFYNKILKRRIFGKVSQAKINNPNNLHKMEKLIFEEFILKSNDDVRKNLEFLTVVDKKNLNHYLKFMIIDSTDPDNLPKKLSKLGLDSTEYEVVKKVNELYTALQRETYHYKGSLEKDKKISEKDKEIVELKNKVTVPDDQLEDWKEFQRQQQEKRAMKKEENINELDHSSQFAAINATQNEVKSKDKNLNKSITTVKKKLN